MTQGFSLTEVLVSLLLITSTSLALLKQILHVHQLFNQTHTRAVALLQLDNTFEHALPSQCFSMQSAIR